MGLFWALFFSISIFFVSIFSENQYRILSNDTVSAVSAVSGNIMVYRNAVSKYAKSYPDITGAAPDTLLMLPTWFRKINGVSNYVVGGKAYIYYDANQYHPELAYRLLKNTGNSALVGINRGGLLYSPVGGIGSIPIPSAVPDGAIVYAE
jgi:hypothetical protein